eukprot:TRINITY_DN21354_c0_g1_i2.p1 TRINITY_DN21354_c0_g1~~TRINITY_DN21354_c0_g1_i2.p1  ORF type:complete len:464 (-),score=52.66 TRINITY_DN21354_c0_g1_i2:34-1383(-)
MSTFADDLRAHIVRARAELEEKTQQFLQWKNQYEISLQQLERLLSQAEQNASEPDPSVAVNSCCTAPHVVDQEEKDLEPVSPIRERMCEPTAQRPEVLVPTTSPRRAPVRVFPFDARERGKVQQPLSRNGSRSRKGSAPTKPGSGSQPTQRKPTAKQALLAAVAPSERSSIPELAPWEVQPPSQMLPPPVAPPSPELPLPRSDTARYFDKEVFDPSSPTYGAFGIYKNSVYRTETYANGCFTGLVHNVSHLPHGYGIFKFSNGCMLECGHWVSGMAYGRGRYRYPNGDIYDGEWYKDQRHGAGVLRRVGGTLYEEHYIHGKRTKKTRVDSTNTGGVHSCNTSKDSFLVSPHVIPISGPPISSQERSPRQLDALGILREENSPSAKLCRNQLLPLANSHGTPVAHSLVAMDAPPGPVDVPRPPGPQKPPLQVPQRVNPSPLDIGTVENTV